MKNDSDTMQRIYEANPHFEREYIFDESVGISLETHVSDLKKNPAIKVETRVDRDGFTIVRKSLHKGYCVDIDQILNHNPEKARQASLTDLNSEYQSVNEKFSHYSDLEVLKFYQTQKRFTDLASIEKKRKRFMNKRKPIFSNPSQSLEEEWTERPS